MKPKKRIKIQIRSAWIHIAMWAVFLLLSLFRGYGIPSGTGYTTAFTAAILLGLGTAIYMAVSMTKADKPKSPQWWLITASLLLLSLSLFARIPALHDFSFEAIEGDPGQYILEAKTSPLFSTALMSQKSPFYDLVVKAVGTVAGYDAGMMRGLGFFFSLTWIPVLLILGRRLVGQNAAFVAGAALTTLPSWAWMAVRGLREDLTLTVVLLVLIFFLKLHEEVTRGRVIGFVALSAVLLLIRFDALPFLGLAALIAFIAKKELRRTMALALGIFVLLFAASSLAQQKHYGHISYHSNMYARWFANQEFVGQPGFPQRNASGGVDNSYAGPRISLGDYVIGMHSPGQLADRAFLSTLIRFPTLLTFFWLGEPPRVLNEAPVITAGQAGGKLIYLVNLAQNKADYQPGAASQLIGSVTFFEAVVILVVITFIVSWLIGVFLYVRSEFWIIIMVPLASLFSIFYVPIYVFPPRVVMYAFPLMGLLAIVVIRRLYGKVPPTAKKPDPVTGSVW